MLSEEVPETADQLLAKVVDDGTLAVPALVQGPTVDEYSDGLGPSLPVVLPGEEWIEQLKASGRPLAGTPSSLLLSLGIGSLWKGTMVDLEQAKVHFETAVRQRPSDVDMVGWLAVTYSVLALIDHDYKEAAGMMTNRAAAIAPEALSSLRARSAFAFMGENWPRAADMAEQCMAMGEEQDVGGLGFDPFCGLVFATTKNDMNVLDQLEDGLGGGLPLDMARTQIAWTTGKTDVVQTAALKVIKQMPDQGYIWSLRMKGYLLDRRWKDAVSAADEVIRLQANEVGALRVKGRVYLQCLDEPELAASAYDALVGHPAFADQPNRADWLAEAAAASLQVGQTSHAGDLAARALALDTIHPAAALYQHIVHVQLDGRRNIDGSETSAASGNNASQSSTGVGVGLAISNADLERLQGRDLARFHLGLARIFRLEKRYRLAMSQLEAALEVDETWPEIHHEVVATHLSMGQLKAAKKRILLLASLEHPPASQFPDLMQLYLPPESFVSLNEVLAEALHDHAVDDVDSEGFLAVLAWSTGQSDAAERLLQARDRLGQGADAFSPDIALAVEAALAQEQLDDATTQEELTAVVSVLEALVAKAPNNAFFRGILGRAHFLRAKEVNTDRRHQSLREAEREMREGLQRDPNGVLLHLWYGELLLYLGQIGEAKGHLERSEKARPGDLKARELMLALENGGR